MQLRLALATPAQPPGARFSAAMAVSVLVHVAVIVVLGWKLPDLRSAAAPHNVLEVVLVNARSALAPDRPDVLAQANLDGGGSTDQDLRTSSPVPAVDSRASAPPTPTLPASANTPVAPSSMLAPDRPDVLAQANLDGGGSTDQDLRTSSPVPAVDSRASAPTTPTPPASANAAVAPSSMLAVPAPDAPAAAADLRTPERPPASEARAREMLDRTQEMVRLEAQVRRDYEANQKRRRTEFVGARASEYRFAAYVDNWRNKVERIGNLNYPAEARRQRLYGSLQMTVVLRADGEIESVTLNRSSGNRVLDEAAMRIVRMAGPYDRFPDSIARDTDFISITRTWTFSREDAVSAR